VVRIGHSGEALGLEPLLRAARIGPGAFSGALARDRRHRACGPAVICVACRQPHLARGDAGRAGKGVAPEAVPAAPRCAGPGPLRPAGQPPGARSELHAAGQRPLTSRLVPVMKLAAGLTRNAAARATSAGLAIRPAGFRTRPGHRHGWLTRAATRRRRDATCRQRPGPEVKAGPQVAGGRSLIAKNHRRYPTDCRTGRRARFLPPRRTCRRPRWRAPACNPRQGPVKTNLSAPWRRSCRRSRPRRPLSAGQRRERRERGHRFSRDLLHCSARRQATAGQSARPGQKPV